MVAEYASGAAPSSPSKEYIYAGSQLLATLTGSTANYHIADHLSPRVTTDSTGTVVGQQAHFPFGEDWYASSSTTKFKFTSYERDTESGNDYALMRTSVNRLGRFSSPDPLAGSLSDPQSLNRYAYVLNDPVNLADPLGLWCQYGVYTQYNTDGSVAYTVDMGGICYAEILDDPGGISQGTPNPGDPPDIGRGGGGNLGRGLLPVPPPPPPPGYEECKAALKAAKKTFQGLQRALDQWPALKAVGFAMGVDPRVLGAIGIKETNFQNITGDFGHGHGVFQIDDRFHPREAATIAYDVDLAANFAAGLVMRNYLNYSERGFAPAVSLAAGLRDYNGTGGIPTTTVLANGWSLDVGTANGNYVSQLLAIAKYCF
jgi:RHS repeat-associated protein